MICRTSTHRDVKNYAAIRNNKYLVLAFISSTLEGKKEIMYSATNIGRLGFVHGNACLGKTSSRTSRDSNYSVELFCGVVGDIMY
jgi:hypothetical protein